MLTEDNFFPLVPVNNTHPQNPVKLLSAMDKKSQQM